MMPVVRVSDATFADLATLSKWFKIKSTSETLDRVVSEIMDSLDLVRDGEQDENAEPGAALSFTRVIDATVAGQSLEKSNWAQILLSTIAELKGLGHSGENLVRELQVPARSDRYEDNGYRFHEQLGISIQGQSATDAWREISRLGDKWGVPVWVKFQWKDNPKAKHPGQVSELSAGKSPTKRRMF